MDWDALVQSLWEIIDSQGTEAFQACLRAGVLDQPADGLLYALDTLHAAGAREVFRALLLETLKNSPSSNRVKHRLQMLLRFQIPHTQGHIILIEDRIELLDKISDLVRSNGFAEAIDKLHATIAMKEDSELLELLGRVYLLQRSHVSREFLTSEKTTTTPQDGEPDFSSLGSGEDLDLFIWRDTPFVQESTHDNECIEAAVGVQALISNSTPTEPKAIEWSLDPENWEQASFSSSEAKLSAPDNSVFHSLSANGASSPNHSVLNDGESSLEVTAQEASKSYFDFQLVKLQSEDKELLSIIRANPKSGADQLARTMKMRPPVLNHTLGTRLRYWIERDRLGGFSIKQELLSLLADSAFEGHNSNTGGNSMPPTPHASISQDEKQVWALMSGVPTLPDQAKRVLSHFIQNPGQKTYEAADALKLNHMVLLSLLDGCLEDYLEKDRSFAVRPRLHGGVEDAEANLVMSTPHLSDSNIGVSRILDESEVLKLRKQMAHRTNQINHDAAPDGEADITLADIAKAAALSRLPPLGKQILALLASAGKGYSRDLARKLEHDVDEVNKMLLHRLSEHVSVIHSVWRLNNGVIEALKLAAII